MKQKSPPSALQPDSPPPAFQPPVSSLQPDSPQASSLQSVVIRIPVQFRRPRGGAVVILPQDQPATGFSTPEHRNLAVLLAKAFLWQGWLDTGRFDSVQALAGHLGQDRSYVAKLLGLTLLAPDIVTAISLGQQPAPCTLTRLLRGLPAGWEEQRRALGFAPQATR